MEILNTGCEGRRITLGLHLSMEKILRKTEIDYSCATINNMKKNMKKLEEKYGRIEDFFMKKEDFTNKEFTHEKMQNKLGMLFLFPSQKTDTIIRVIRKVSPDFTIISKNMYHLYDNIEEQNIENILQHVKAACYLNYVTCTAIDYKRVTDRETVLIGVIKK